MAIHGVKVNNAELQKYLDSVLRQQFTKAKKIGEEAVKLIMTRGLDYWYINDVSYHMKYSSLRKSVGVKSEYSQNSRFLYVDVTGYVDEGKYRYFTSHYRIYNYNNSAKISDPAGFMLGMIWEDGIVGLPAKDRNGRSWPHIQADDSLEVSLTKYFKLQFKRTFNKLNK